MTADELIGLFGIDLNEYEISKVTHWEQRPDVWCNSIRLTRNPTGVDLELIEQQVEAMKDHAPHILRIDEQSLMVDQNQPWLGEIDLFDLHLQLLSWAAETGQDYDSEIAERDYKRCMEELAGDILCYSGAVQRWLIPVGQDILHTDTTIAGTGGQTTAGTPQDVDTRWKRAFVQLRDMAVSCAEMLAGIAPVELVIVPGNHDTERAFMLGDSLYAWFHNDPRVNVHNQPKKRKYYQWGKTLLGYTHGKNEPLKKLPAIMAHEAPKMWANTEWREWKLGHVHSKHETSVEGVLIRQLRAIASRDSWHTDKGFMSRRGAEAHLYHADAGEKATFYVNLPSRYTDE
jgi:hypothetical protein